MLCCTLLVLLLLLLMVIVRPCASSTSCTFSVSRSAAAAAAAVWLLLLLLLLQVLHQCAVPVFNAPCKPMHQLLHSVKKSAGTAVWFSSSNMPPPAAVALKPVQQ